MCNCCFPVSLYAFSSESHACALFYDVSNTAATVSPIISGENTCVRRLTVVCDSLMSATVIAVATTRAYRTCEAQILLVFVCLEKCLID